MFSPWTSRLKWNAGRPLLAIAALAILAGCSEEVEEVRDVVRPVKVIEIAGNDTGRSLSYSGSVVARREMALAFRVGGKITSRTVDIGDRVEAGATLATLDATDLELSRKSAEASLMAAERQVETAQLALSRAERLHQKNVAAQSQLEEAQLAFNQAAATRDAAVAAMEQARNQVSYAALSAPASGMVTSVEAESGQVVAAGTPVVTVALDGEKEVSIAVPETDIQAFAVSKTVSVRFWFDEALVLDGTVREVAGSADQRSRTFAVRVSLPDHPRIRLGMTATVSATVETGPQLVSVPLSALAERGDDRIVWTVNAENRTVHARAVEIDGFDDGGVRIERGLSPGDVVVVAGTQFMREGLEVKLSGERQETAAGTSASPSILR